MKKNLVLAAIAALSLGTAAAEAAPQTGVTTLASGANQSLVQARGGRGGWSYYGAGPNYYQQQYPGPNCYSVPHPVYGWICY